jgi:hypothetical protein
MKSLFKKFHNEAGQGTVEYVLLLIFVIGVVLGGLYQLNSAFQVFANNYFGDYLACLLETGELPALDGVGGTCNASYQSFSFASGRPLETSSGPSAAGAGGAATGGGYSASAAQAAAAAAAGRSNTFSIGSTQVAASSPSRFLAGGSGGDSGSQTNTGSLDGDNLGGYQGTKVIRIPLRRSERGITGSRGYEDEVKDKEKVKVAPTSQSIADEKRKELMMVVRKPAASKAPEIEEFTFSNFLRYLIIAAIIIAILFFIGSQAMQVSKSME